MKTINPCVQQLRLANGTHSKKNHTQTHHCQTAKTKGRGNAKAAKDETVIQQ